MLPWTPRRWGAGEEQAPRERRPSASSGLSQAWDSREKALAEPGTALSLLNNGYDPSPHTGHHGLCLRDIQTWSREGCDRSISVPLSLRPQPSALASKAFLDSERGPSCASGVSFSGRTLHHPSFWPLYQAASCRGFRPSLAGHRSEEHVPRTAGFPVISSEDVFFLDPLLPHGQRVPLYLSEAPQQVSAPPVMGSLKLLLPRPIMSPWLLPTPSSGCSTTWLSGPELIALTGLLQMSQGEPRPSSSGAPGLPSGPPAPASDHPVASGDPGCSHCGEPSLPRTPDAQGP
uniref:Sin3A associated protein 25 n=1 Tax=Moschus moschiferus TaxID=68415 RepID=A0A8C6DHD8_MOSMO